MTEEKKKERFVNIIENEIFELTFHGWVQTCRIGFWSSGLSFYFKRRDSSRRLELNADYPRGEYSIYVDGRLRDRVAVRL